ncbi:hypothetical protein DMENIID0001_163530 [Sergentomyia squamirostris]
MIAGYISLISCVVTLTSGITVSPIVRHKYVIPTTKLPQMIAYFQPSPQIRSKSSDSVSSAAIYGQDVIKVVQPPDNVRGKEFLRGGSRSDLRNRVKLSPMSDYANPGLKALPIQIDPRQQAYLKQKNFYLRPPASTPSHGYDINPVMNQLQVLRQKHQDLFADDEGAPQFDQKPTKPMRKPPMGYDIVEKEKENFRNNITPQQRRRKPPQRQKIEEKNKTSVEEVPTRFVPTRLYAQVRHSMRQKHRPRQLEEPRIREKVSTAKKHVVYSEDGYEDAKYDHGDEEKFADHRERRRAKRDTEAASEMPMALALIATNANLTGEEMLEYLEEVIKNSTKYLPDTADDDRFSFTSHLMNKTEIEKLFTPPDPIESESRTAESKDKYPFYFLPPNQHVPQSSALRYAESPRTLPRAGQTFYDTKNRKRCEEIDQEVDAEKDMQRKRRLKDLGGKIDCIREKFFGADPLDNPIFHEEFVDAQETTTTRMFSESPETFQKLNHHQNPMINVYDDVISNIRAAVIADTLNRHTRNRQNYLKKVEPERPARPESKTPKSEEQTKTVKTESFPIQNGPVFDITHYFPPMMYLVQSDSGKIYRINPQHMMKHKRKVNKAKEMLRQKTKDYTVFPTADTATVHKFRPHLIVHPIMSSGNHPYMALKKSKQRKFHYEGFIFH